MLISKAHPYGWVNNEKLRSETITKIDKNVINLQDKLVLQNWPYKENPFVGVYTDCEFGWLNGLVFGPSNAPITPIFILVGDRFAYSVDGYLWTSPAPSDTYQFVAIHDNNAIITKNPVTSSTIKLCRTDDGSTFNDIVGPDHGDTVIATAIHNVNDNLSVISYANGIIEYLTTPSTLNNATVPAAWNSGNKYVIKFASSSESIIGVTDSLFDVFIRSVDDGVNWLEISAPSQSNWKIAYNSILNVYMIVNSDSKVYTSLDEGLTWQDSEPSNELIFNWIEPLGEMFVASSSDGEASYISYTDDLGKTWHRYVIGEGIITSLKSRDIIANEPEGQNLLAILDDGSTTYFRHTLNLESDF